MPDQVRHDKLESDPDLFLPVIADLIRNPCPRISWMPDRARHDKLEGVVACHCGPDPQSMPPDFLDAGSGPA